MGYVVPWVVAIGAGFLALVGIYAITRPIPYLYLKTVLRCLAMVILLLPNNAARLAQIGRQLILTITRPSRRSRTARRFS